MRIRLLFAYAGVLAAFNSAYADQVTNGDFSAGLLGWTVFTTPNGYNLVSVTKFNVTGSQVSNAVRIEAGQVIFTPGVNEGAGVEQTVTLTGGTYDFSAAIAASEFPTGNGDFGTITALIGGSSIASFGFGAQGPGTYRHTLNGEFTVPGGTYLLQVEATRPYNPDPFDYITNISIQQAPSTVPEPSTLVLMGTGIYSGFHVLHRKRTTSYIQKPRRP